jgi:hypothetical protein
MYKCIIICKLIVTQICIQDEEEIDNHDLINNLNNSFLLKNIYDH